MPDLIRHPEGLLKNWIPAFAGMTTFLEIVFYGRTLIRERRFSHLRIKEDVNAEIQRQSYHAFQ